MIDTHAHLDFPQFDADREEIIRLAHQEGVELIINIGTDLAFSEKSVALAEAHPGIFATVGVHPHDAKTWDSKTSPARLEKLANHPRVVAIGEIGLDFYRNFSPREDQQRAFADQIAVARKMNLPIVVHNREAFADVFAMLLEHGAHEVGGVMHCFAGTVDEAWKTIDYGFYISVGGRLTYPNSRDVPVVAEIPLHRLLVETDCPYLTPAPFRGKRNHPTLVKYVRAKIAEIKGVSEEEVDAVTAASARALFRLDHERTTQSQ